MMAAHLEHNVIRRKHMVPDKADFGRPLIVVPLVPELSSGVSDVEGKAFALYGLGYRIRPELLPSFPHQGAPHQPCYRRRSHHPHKRAKLGHSRNGCHPFTKAAVAVPCSSAVTGSRKPGLTRFSTLANRIRNRTALPK